MQLSTKLSVGAAQLVPKGQIYKNGQGSILTTVVRMSHFYNSFPIEHELIELLEYESHLLRI